MKAPVFSWILLGTTVLVLSTGCPPGRSVHGSVHTVPTEKPTEDESELYDSGKPITNAEITYWCSDRSAPGPRTRADEEGKFSLMDFGYWNPDCTFRISHEDYYPQEFRVDDMCVAGKESHCSTVHLQAELLPRSDEYDIRALQRVAGSRYGIPPVELEPTPSPPVPARDVLKGATIGLVSIQSVGLLFSLPTRRSGGAYVIGTIYGMYALVPVGLAIGVEDTGRKLLMSALSLPLAAFSYYNFRYAREHSSSRKFWTNLAGWNVSLVALGTVLWAEPQGPSREVENLQPRGGIQDLRFGFTGTGISLEGRF